MKKAAVKRGWTVVVAASIIIILLLSWQENSSSATAFIIISQTKKYQQQQQQQQQKRHKRLVPSSTTSNICFAETSTTLFITRLSSKAKKDYDNNDDNDDDDSSSNRQENQQWLMERFKFTKELIKQRSHNWRLLTQDNSILEGRADDLQELLGFNNKEMNRVVQMHPMILNHKSDTSIRPTLNCLEAALKLDKIDLKKLVLTYPSVLMTSKDNIEPKLEYLQSRLEMDEATLKKIIQISPSILTRNINSIIGRIDYLEQRLNLTNDTQQVSQIIRKFPNLFHISVDKLESILTWLQNRLCVSDTRLTHIIRIQPSLLGCSITENLEPTLEFYIQAAKETTSEEDAITLVANNPIFLAFGLETRLKPRLKQLQEENYTIDIAALRVVAKLTKKQWENGDYEKRL